MFEMSFHRPRNFFSLPASKQWEIDKALGILDWEGTGMTSEDLTRFKSHYES